MRLLAAIALLCAALAPFSTLILYVDWRHMRVGDPRRASWRTVRNCKVICVAAMVFMALAVAAQARSSPYPSVTQFNGDRYSGHAQMGAEVANAVHCPPPACQRKRIGKSPRKRPSASRHRLDGHPMPRPRPGAVEPLSVTGGMWREAGRVAAQTLGGRPQGCPSRFCGCGASLHLFGRIIPALNLAANWLRFPRTAPAPKMVAARRGHVFVLERHIAGNLWLVHDSNSGGRRTRIHQRSIAGYSIVNPRG